MKFLTIGTFKDSVYSVPQAEQTKFRVEAVNYVLALKKKMGDKWHFYSDPSGSTSISIGEYNSLEEYAQSLQASPTAMAGYMDYECIPLIEMDEKEFKAWVDSQKSAK
jgi:hypothetical protein